jgi:mannitol/fructose-specific phosphotransferase system IIA component (Ntr-type)
MAHDVFISHSTGDKAVSDAVCAALESDAIPCWVAPRDVQPGLPFPGEITRAVRQSKVMVLIYSEHSNNSTEVLREVQLAAEAHLHVIQFRIQQVPPSDDLKYYLSAPHWLDAMTPPLEHHLVRLVSAVKALMALHDEDQRRGVLPSHSAATNVEVSDATLFRAIIHLSPGEESKAEFFRQLRPLLANFLGEKAEDAVASMVERETILSTGSGFGLGFPHGYRPYVKRFVAGIVLIPEGCDWHAADGRPVFVVLLYIGAGDARSNQALRLMGSAQKAAIRILSSSESGPPRLSTFEEVIGVVRDTLTNAGLSVGFVSFS